jgi:hypothetical protein
MGGLARESSPSPTPASSLLPLSAFPLLPQAINPLPQLHQMPLRPFSIVAPSLAKSPRSRKTLMLTGPAGHDGLSGRAHGDLVAHHGGHCCFSSSMMIAGASLLDAPFQHQMRSYSPHRGFFDPLQPAAVQERHAEAYGKGGWGEGRPGGHLTGAGQSSVSGRGLSALPLRRSGP